MPANQETQKNERKNPKCPQKPSKHPQKHARNTKQKIKCPKRPKNQNAYLFWELEAPGSGLFKCIHTWVNVFVNEHVNIKFIKVFVLAAGICKVYFYMWWICLFVYVLCPIGFGQTVSLKNTSLKRWVAKNTRDSVDQVGFWFPFVTRRT